MWRVSRVGPSHCRVSQAYSSSSTGADSKGLQKVSKGFWDSHENRRRFMDCVAQEFKVERPEDWSRVRLSDVRRLKGGGLLERYGGSMARALVDIFPEQEFDMGACRPATLKHHWGDKKRRKELLDKAAAAYGVGQPTDWKKVSGAQVSAMGGAGLLARYQGSLYRALVDTYEDLQGMAPHQLRSKLPQSHWHCMENRKAFLDSVAAQLDLQGPADWKRVGVLQLRQLGGAGLLKKYSGSVFAMLEDVYGKQQHADAALSRARVTNGYWRDEGNVRAFVSKAETKLGIRDAQDWTRVSVAQLSSVGGGTLLNHMTLYDLLAIAYPDVEWRRLRGGEPKKSTQFQLIRAVRDVLDVGTEPRRQARIE